MVSDMENLSEDTGFHAEIAQTLYPVATSDLPGDVRIASAAPLQEGYRSLVCIPLLAQDSLVGSVQIATKYDHEWEEEELRWLALIGRLIGSLIYQIQLSERLRDLAVLEERSRIAQEIHDGLAQLIGSMRLWSDDALLSLENDNLKAVENSLNKIESAARDAYSSLRDEMLGLRVTIFPDKDLLAVISEYLTRFQRQWGLNTILTIDESARNSRPWPISPEAEIQLIRILQEALTNVRRHADASKIFVRMSTTETRLRVRISDDGLGFDVDQIPEDRLGMRIMRERAAHVSGSITVTSKPGAGTNLDIEIPLRKSESPPSGG